MRDLSKRIIMHVVSVHIIPKNNEKRFALMHNVMLNLLRASVYFFAVAMTPEVWLLASSVLWTIYVLSRRKAECRSFICQAITLKLQKNCCTTAAAIVKKLRSSAVIFFYIDHTSTPTKAKLNARANKSNAN